MDRTRDVAVIVGSLRKDSINRKVANALAELAPAALKPSMSAQGPMAKAGGVASRVRLSARRRAASAGSAPRRPRKLVVDGGRVAQLD